MGGKWVELLKEISSRIVRVALLFNPATAVPLEFFMPSIQAAASSFGIQMSTAPVHAKDEIESVFAPQARDPGGSLINSRLVQRDKSRTDHFARISLWRTGELFLSPLCGRGWLDHL